MKFLKKMRRKRTIKFLTLDTFQPLDTMETYTIKHYTSVINRHQRLENYWKNSTVVELTLTSIIHKAQKGGLEEVVL
jgi:hypothetical protein